MDTSNKQYRNLRLFRLNVLLLLSCLSGIIVIILASNLDFFCIPKHNRPFNISNEELFLIYSVIFTIINFFLLKLSSSLKYPNISHPRGQHDTDCSRYCAHPLTLAPRKRSALQDGRQSLQVSVACTVRSAFWSPVPAASDARKYAAEFERRRWR